MEEELFIEIGKLRDPDNVASFQDDLVRFMDARDRVNDPDAWEVIMNEMEEAAAFVSSDQVFTIDKGPHE